MALVAGMLWALGTTGMRAKSTLGPMPATFVFAIGAALTACAVAPGFEPWPDTGASLPLLLIALFTGALWWGVSLAALMWATLRLDPARVGILMQTEVLVGALSAALLAGEHLAPLEILGGALVVVAGLLEVLPVRRKVSLRGSGSLDAEPSRPPRH